MQAMILAAGRGERMGELTKNIPKPLLKVGNKTLIEHNIEKLYNAKIFDIVVNTHYLGDKIIKHLQNYDIKFSEEKQKLESAGGIIYAFDKLDEVFVVINADVLSDYDINKLTLPKNSLAHLVLVDNPEHNPNGDFDFNGKKLTFSGIGIYHKSLFDNYLNEKYLQLGKVLKENTNKISFEYHSGFWLDVGTPERLDFANSFFANSLST
jgi:MurNAc alpha-1-phosphate uridylyltransferase